MFTGLIESICTVKSVRQSAGGLLLTVDLDKLAPASNERGQANETKTGDSIAVNGVCLTITKLDGRLADFDVSAETLTKSNLGKLKPASEVNVELAMKAADRFGGHIVTGHIDGTAKIKQIDRQGKFVNMKFAGGELLDLMVVKGSVAVDGISLTIADLGRASFSAAVIPQTLERTTLGKAKIGDEVNIETDVLAKIMQKQLEKVLPKEENLTIEKLKQLGF